jgi:hypothetical protein
MWSSQKMKFAAFIHYDDMKCFHVAVQETHKLVVMGHINFEDHALIKWRYACKKMNATGRRFKDKKKQGIHKKQFTFVARSCAHFWSFGVHNSMSAKSAIEKLQRIAKEKEV